MRELRFDRYFSIAGVRTWMKLQIIDGRAHAGITPSKLSGPDNSCGLDRSRNDAHVDPQASTKYQVLPTDAMILLPWLGIRSMEYSTGLGTIQAIPGGPPWSTTDGQITQAVLGNISRPPMIGCFFPLDEIHTHIRSTSTSYIMLSRVQQPSRYIISHPLILLSHHIFLYFPFLSALAGAAVSNNGDRAMILRSRAGVVPPSLPSRPEVFQLPQNSKSLNRWGALRPACVSSLLVV